MLTSGPVVIMQVPEQFKGRDVQSFMAELEPLLESNRPRIVLDCSLVRSMDSAGVEALLRGLEETLKRDGDLKLAALSPESEVILELMRVARVFEAFPTSDDAIRSFNVGVVEAVPGTSPWYGSAFGDLGILKQAS
jgi:anti-sigma B factor antagonist